MNPNTFPRRFLIIQYFIAITHSLGISFLVLFHKSTPDATVLTSISIFRLLVITLPFSIFIIAAFSLQQLLIKPADPNHIIKYIFDRSSSAAMIHICAMTLISIGLLGVCLPAYHFGSYSAHYTRIQPIMIWSSLLGLQLLSLIFFPRRTEIYKQLLEVLKENRSLLRTAFGILLSLIFMWAFIAMTGVGISGNEDYWYEAGVPILPAQILFAILAGLLFDHYAKKTNPTHPMKMDRWIFWGIWVLSALFWVITPAPNSYMNPSPLAPNHEVYPYSDAAGYDFQSQYALAGQGLNNGKATDNPMYPAFLVLVHLVSGQNYAANMAVQAAIYAFFPSLIYLLGKKLFGQTLGISAAIMITLRGYNSIVAASLINLASPKQMLTDFPTAIGIALSILALITWVDKERENSSHAIWHGGLIGFTFLIRPTALVLLVIAPAIALLQGLPYGKLLRAMSLTLAGFIIFVTPWGIRNSLTGSNALNVYFSKINLVKNARFPEVSEAQSQSSIDQPEQAIEDSQPKNSEPKQYTTALNIILSHYSHNLTGSILILPASPIFDDLRHTIKSSSKIWTPNWNGDLGLAQGIGLFVSLALLSMGFAAAWKRLQFIGLIPLMFFLIYQFANSVGRTSGGRYIVPVDWVILVYFAAGVIESCRIIFRTTDEKAMLPEIKVTAISKSMPANLAVIFFLGTIPVLLELSLTFRHPAIQDIDLQQFLSQSTYSKEDITNFLQEDNAVFLTGQAMYPRYFNYHAVSRQTEGMMALVNFPHLEFALLSESKNRAVILYQQTPVQLSNNTNVIILGCREKGSFYVDAIAMMVSNPAKAIYTHGANPPLTCPLPQPICDNNGNCD